MATDPALGSRADSDRVTAVAHFGARGSFGEAAVHAWAVRAGIAVAPVERSSPAEVLAALADGTADLAILPVANSSSGLVRPTLEALGSFAFEPLDEIALPVRFSLLVRHEGIELGSIARVASHPQAFSQCQRFLVRELPEAERIEVGDTASAARALAEGKLDERTAVLASARAGEVWGLRALRRDVQDDPDDRTFFVVLRRGLR